MGLMHRNVRHVTSGRAGMVWENLHPIVVWVGNSLPAERVGAQRYEDIEPALADGPLITHELGNAV